MPIVKYGIIEKSFPWLVKAFILSVLLDIANIVLQLNLPVPMLYGMILLFSLSEYRIIKKVYILHFFPFLSFFIFWIFLKVLSVKDPTLEVWGLFEGVFTGVYIIYTIFYLYLAKLFICKKDSEERAIIFHVRNLMIFVSLISIGKLLKLFNFSIISFNLAALNGAVDVYTIVFVIAHIFVLRKKTNAVPAEQKVSKKSTSALSLSPELLEQYKATVEDFFSCSREYTKPSFSITVLAERTGIPKHHLSFLFNHYLKQNFNEYLAKFRIDYAVEMMSNDSYMNMTIESIAFECGYSSATTFNKWFKFFMHCLPNEFIKDLNHISKVESTTRL